MSTYEKNASSMGMKRNDSDFNARTGPTKHSHKYNSIDRGSGLGDENMNEVSPMILKKKANVHLLPMTHKKAKLMKGAALQKQNDVPMNHSESNPLLAPVINDRVKLEKLNHIPSVKSNLMQSETNLS